MDDDDDKEDAEKYPEEPSYMPERDFSEVTILREHIQLFIFVPESLRYRCHFPSDRLRQFRPIDPELSLLRIHGSLKRRSHMMKSKQAVLQYLSRGTEVSLNIHSTCMTPADRAYRLTSLRAYDVFE